MSDSQLPGVSRRLSPFLITSEILRLGGPDWKAFTDPFPPVKEGSRSSQPRFVLSRVEAFSILSVPGLDTPIMYVKGVGPRVSEMLAAKGILTAEDLLYHLPFRYEDRQNPRQPG